MRLRTPPCEASTSGHADHADAMARLDFSLKRKDNKAAKSEIYHIVKKYPWLYRGVDRMCRSAESNRALFHCHKARYEQATTGSEKGEAARLAASAAITRSWVGWRDILRYGPFVRHRSREFEDQSTLWLEKAHSLGACGSDAMLIHRLMKAANRKRLHTIFYQCLPNVFRTTRVDAPEHLRALELVEEAVKAGRMDSSLHLDALRIKVQSDVGRHMVSDIATALQREDEAPTPTITSRTRPHRENAARARKLLRADETTKREFVR